MMLKVKLAANWNQQSVSWYQHYASRTGPVRLFPAFRYLSQEARVVVGADRDVESGDGVEKVVDTQCLAHSPLLEELEDQNQNQNRQPPLL